MTLRRSTTPDVPLRLAISGASGAAPTRLTMKASSFTISRLRDASSPAVYASRRALPHAMQDSLPAGGLRLCRAGVEPAGSLREVSAHVILLSRAYPGAIIVIDAKMSTISICSYLAFLRTKLLQQIFWKLS